MSTKVEINLESEDLLADSEYNIIIENLTPNRKYELRQELMNYYCINAPMKLDPKVNWQAKIVMQSDAFGRISLKDNRAISGSYQGIAQMGLFFNSQPEKMRKVLLPQNFSDIQLNQKFQIKISVSMENKLVAENTFERYFQSPNITSKDINLGQAYGRVFYERGAVNQLAIIVLSGSDGRIEKAQNIAQLFASRGFVALAVCFFGLAGLPKNLAKIPIEIVAKSADYLKALPQVDENRIGIYGRSKGAELALVAATYVNEFKCVVVNSPTIVILEGIKGWRNSRSSSWTYGGKELPYVKFRLKEFLQAKITKKNMPLENKMAEIQIEKYTGALLCIGAKQDEIWDSGHAIAQISKKMKKRSKSAGIFEEQLYENSGHMLTIAYQPNNRYKKKFNWDKTLLDATNSWKRTINFFQENL
ncbi:acyl-CoA thioester hydrolase/BAAT C-terminal domain-containing protein [Enterococcus sp. HY326]|uniref:acyl-CoA thioester hydrolase/BAAT C-terminal domain-containing protein n=1 Tax=Enterococcus sp. HY326 TaxID=2971265 RepID=UPI0022404431|nr:acyl-CoA thioester hydrolase/BAAT C-terminal domain-containing protein [Enterococcus sp. HY326]